MPVISSPPIKRPPARTIQQQMQAEQQPEDITGYTLQAHRLTKDALRESCAHTSAVERDALPQERQHGSYKEDQEHGCSGGSPALGEAEQEQASNQDLTQRQPHQHWLYPRRRHQGGVKTQVSDNPRERDHRRPRSAKDGR